MAASNEPFTGAPFTCVGRAMQTMVRALAQPNVSTRPGGGPADGVPAKGVQNHAVERLDVGWSLGGVPRQADRNKSDHGKRRRRAAALGVAGGGVAMRGRGRPFLRDTASHGPTTIVAPKSQFRTSQQIMVKRLATSRHDPLDITDSACKNQLVVVSVQYGPFNTYIPIRSTTIGKSRVSRDPIAMHTSWRLNSDIASVTRVSMTFRVARTNQYNQDLGLIHSTNGNHLESPNEGSSIDHQVTIHLHAQNITMFPTDETWYFASHMLVSNSGGLILILTAQSTRNEFRIHSDY
ncbi:hypothetical protein F511_37881 [Dorcoceras hygrometricum]|uniref:Triacylglycerol lipase n=1 Tax=Dorcoceras hygrometricum TaxID=472368 RepID=A0A2Z7AY02_9LAMI|nr:hypothetical protein F511_37881 [Dorcoceras hygrometricum]